MSEIDNIIQRLSNLTIIESVELVKKIEKLWGVNVNSNSINNANTTNKIHEEKPKKTSFNVILNSYGIKKISIIKELKVITGLSLLKAKEIVDSLPKTIKNSISIKEAEEIKNRLQDIGGKVTIE